MCHFISWIEKPNGDVLFLTAKQIFETKRGKELQKHCQNNDDLVGHGAIRFYYKYQGGIERERTDFSTPDNFPKPIVSAIKLGKFRWMGTPEELLSSAAWAEYEKIKETAWAEYEKIKETAWAEYEKIRDAALAEYEKIQKPALAEYEKIQKPALAEYEKIRDAAFWNLFRLKKNRNPNWR